jgi:hypothetical protein
MYVYCPRPSTSAYELIKALGATRLRRFDGMDFWTRAKRVKLDPTSTIICWGASVPGFDGARIINSLDAPLNKFQEWMKLTEAGISTVVMAPADGGNRPETLKKMNYLPRTFRHQGGADLLAPQGRADFWVQKEKFTQEYRIHSFDGRSIRAGVKIPREGFTEATEADWKPDANLVHPWIRSFDAGWRINYDDFKSTKDMRGIAHAAVKALGLTFGAVDIALDNNGYLKVLEVNTAPGSDPNTTAAYLRAFKRYFEAPEAPEEPAREVKILEKAGEAKKAPLDPGPLKKIIADKAKGFKGGGLNPDQMIYWRDHIAPPKDLEAEQRAYLIEKVILQNAYQQVDIRKGERPQFNVVPQEWQVKPLHKPFPPDPEPEPIYDDDDNF